MPFSLKAKTKSDCTELHNADVSEIISTNPWKRGLIGIRLFPVFSYYKQGNESKDECSNGILLESTDQLSFAGVDSSKTDGS